MSLVECLHLFVVGDGAAGAGVERHQAVDDVPHILLFRYSDPDVGVGRRQGR